jgi:hypothetical protein
MTIDGYNSPNLLGQLGINSDSFLEALYQQRELRQGTHSNLLGREKAIPSTRVLEAIVEGGLDSGVVLELISFLRQRGVEFPQKIFETFIKAARLRAISVNSGSLAKGIALAARMESKEKPFLFIGKLRKRLQVPPLWKKIVPAEGISALENPKKFIEDIEREFLENSGIRELDDGIKGYREMLYTGMRKVSEKLQRVLPERLYPALIDSLKKDYDEVLGERLKESIFQKIMDESIENVLKKAFESGFAASYDLVHRSVNQLTNEMSDFAPPFVRGTLETFGIARLSNNEFWIEVNYESETFYSVTIHGDDSAGRLGEKKLPLTYSHVPEELIGVKFWTALLRFSSSVDNDEPIEFIIKDVVLTLDDLLKRTGETVRPPMDCRGPFEMLQSYCGQRVDPALIADLFEDKEKKEVQSATFEHDRKEVVILPPFVRKLIEDMGANASDIHYLKEIVSAILGKDATVALQLLLEEIPKGIPKKSVAVEKLDKSFFAEIKTMRFSLLHLARLASRISTLMANWISWTVTLDCLVYLITLALPGLNLVLSIPVRYLCGLLLMYGVPVLARYLPPVWIKSVAKIFSMYSDGLKILERKMTVMLLKFGSRMILSRQFVDEMKEKLLAVQSEFTRGGELDFRVVRKELPVDVEDVEIVPRIAPQTDTVHVEEVEGRAYPIPELTKITAENLISTIDRWKETVTRFKETPFLASDFMEINFYLNQQLRNLPIPGEEGGDMWEKLENPDVVLKHLMGLLKLFYLWNYSKEEAVELSISLYTIYVIIDSVAKHPKTTYRIPEEYLANGKAFLLWQNSLGVNAINSRTRAKLRAISTYFKGDPDKIYTEGDSFPPALFEFTEDLFNAKIPELDRKYLLGAALPLRTVEWLDKYSLQDERVISLFCECPDLSPYYSLRAAYVFAADSILNKYPRRFSSNASLFQWTKDPIYFELQAKLRRATQGIFTQHHIQFYTDGYDISEKKFPIAFEGYYKNTRTQSELVVKGPLSLAQVKREISLLLSMVEIVPSDQIIRAISLIRQNPDCLRNELVASHFKMFMLRASLIREAFLERKLLLRDVAILFLELFEEVKDDEKVALFVAHVADDFIRISSDFDPDIRLHTPDFRSIVTRKFRSDESKFVIAGMCIDFLPETSSDELKAEIINFVQVLNPIVSTKKLGEVENIFQNAYIRARKLVFIWSEYVAQKRTPQRDFGFSIEQRPLNISPKKAVSREWVLDPNKDKHHLHLLGWFQSLEDVKITCEGRFVKQFEFKTMKLIFDVKHELGKSLAYPRDPQLSSYALSKVQKDPRLKEFVNYLVLESESTLERRICIPVPDKEVLFAKHLMHEKKEFLSPFLEKVVTASSFASTYYSFSFNEKGELVSDDPAALAFLTLHYITRKRKKEALLAFQKLSLIGHRKPFCKDTQNFINRILILEFLFRSSSPIFLQLIAVAYTNSLLQSQAPIKEEDQLIEVVLWAMVQSVYSAYITEKKKFLTEYDELFILKYITAHSSVPENLKKFKISLRDLTMLPVCSLRYQFLRRIHGDNPNSWRYKAERALIHKVTNMGSSDFKGLPFPLMRGETSSSYGPELLDAVDHPYISYFFTGEAELSIVADQSITAPPLHLRRLTPKAIQDHFIKYYSILYNREEGHEKLANNLKVMRGKFLDRSAALLLFILQSLAKSTQTRFFFPNPSLLTDKSAQKRLVEVCLGKSLVTSITPKGLFSVGKFIVKKVAKNKLFSYVSPYMVPAFQMAKVGDNIYKGVRLFQAVALPIIPKRMERPPLLRESISDQDFRELVRREAEIDEILTLERGERITSVINRPFQFVYPLTSDAAIVREFEKLNESISLYAWLPKYSNPTHTFTGDKKAILERLSMEEAELESIMGISFNEILMNYIMGYKTEFDLKITLYLVSLSRWKAYFKRSSLERAYKFDEISEKLLRIFLVFEVKAETLIWQRQYGPLINLLNSVEQRKVCEAIMGIGKTATLMPIKDLIDADGESLVINLRPAAIAVSAAEKSAEVSFDLFAQTTSVIPLTRSGWTAERLEVLNLHIDELIFKRGIWDGTKEQFQSLQLRFLEESLDILGAFEKEDKTNWNERLELFQKILYKIKKYASVNIDEAHIEFDRKTELNYPLGIAKSLSMRHAEILEEVMMALLTILPLRGEAPRKITEEKYKREILPRLAQLLSAGDRAIERYFMNEAIYSHRDSRIDLIKGALNTLLPSILGEIVHVDYAMHKEDKVEVAKPSDGNENPEVESTYKIQFAAFLKTTFLFLEDRLNRTQINKMIATLERNARLEIKEDSNPPLKKLNRTHAGIYFKIHSKGYDLFSWKSPSDLETIHKNLNESDLVVLDYCRIYIREQIRYFNYSISCNAHNLAAMFRSFSGYTASPYNAGTYPEGSTVLKDPGTQGETVSLLVERKPSCHTLLNESPSVALEEISTKFFAKGSSFKAIIDRGAVFNGLSNETVAKALLPHIEETDLKAVVFYNAKKELMIWGKGRPSPIPFKESRMPPEDRLTYFDQSHTFAADILQGIGAKAIVTVGESTLAEELFQAVWRMRGLKTKEQDVEFITTGHTKMLIAGDEEVTIEKIIAFCLINQGKESLEDNFASDIAAMHNVIQRAVLDKALESSSVKKMCTIIRSFKDLFLNQNSGDPSDFFGGIDEYITPDQVFRETRRRLFLSIQRCSLFEREEVEQIRERLEGIGHNFYPATVLKRKKIDCRAREQVETEQLTCELEVEKEKMELKQDVKDWLSRTVEKREPVAHKKWPVRITYIDRPERITPKDPHALFSLSHVLKEHSNHEIRPLARYIDPRILLTNNLAPTPRLALDQFQIPILEALVIFNEDGELTQFILISAEEAREHREILRKERRSPGLPDDIKALVDISTGLLAAEGKIRVNQELLKTPELQHIFLQAKFFFGHRHYNSTEEKLLTEYLMRVDLPVLKTFIDFLHNPEALCHTELQGIIYSVRARKEPHTIFLRV